MVELLRNDLQLVGGVWDDMLSLFGDLVGCSSSVEVLLLNESEALPDETEAVMLEAVFLEEEDEKAVLLNATVEMGLLEGAEALLLGATIEGVLLDAIIERVVLGRAETELFAVEIESLGVAEIESLVQAAVLDDAGNEGLLVDKAKGAAGAGWAASGLNTQGASLRFSGQAPTKRRAGSWRLMSCCSSFSFRRPLASGPTPAKFCQVYQATETSWSSERAATQAAP